MCMGFNNSEDNFDIIFTLHGSKTSRRDKQRQLEASC